jgi:hypothetical protein
MIGNVLHEERKGKRIILKTTRCDSNIEKQILTGMIMSTTVLGHIVSKWRPGGLFRSKWANLVSKWCIRYYKKYTVSPCENIVGLFKQWAERVNDEDTIDLVDKFLSGLSNEYETGVEKINPEYLLDLAGQHFNSVLLENTAEAIKAHIDLGNIDKAEAIVAQWNRVEMGVGAGIDVLHDIEAIRSAFESNEKPLIRYPGALGKFFGSQFARDEFVAFMGAAKKNKTWWLMDVAWQGMLQGKRVAFFEVGDMSQNQIMKRFMCRTAGHPVKPPFEFDIPISISREQNQEQAIVETDFRVFGSALDWKTAWEGCQKKLRRHKKSLLKLSVHPNGTINVEGIRAILDIWERDEWIPDIIAIDYADILAPPTGQKAGERESINETWKQLRSLSQSKHILVITATQGDAGSYNTRVIRSSNFSDDRRKNDHVTAMIGINATDEEKRYGICRLNWVIRREEAFFENQCVHVVGCLGIGRPHMFSTF